MAHSEWPFEKKHRRLTECRIYTSSNIVTSMAKLMEFPKTTDRRSDVREM